MEKPDQSDRERLAKIAAMQRLIDEARASGHSDKTIGDVREEAMARLAARSVHSTPNRRD
jgi:hypothetical protein